MNQKNILIAVAGIYAALVNSAYSVELITSKGAWTEDGVVKESNDGLQGNSSTRGHYGSYAGPSFFSNSPLDYLDMVSKASVSVLQAYTAGYTYRYSSTAAAPKPSSADFHTDQVVSLLANGVVISSQSGPNTNDSGIDQLRRNTIVGEYVVVAGNGCIGDSVGMRIGSKGAQSRFFADGSTNLSALLTTHANFNGDGKIFLTSFLQDAAGGLIATDHVADMSIGGNAFTAIDGQVALNNTNSAQNVLNISSATDAFRAETVYRVVFNAARTRAGDDGQRALTVSLGSASVDVLVGSKADSYVCEFDADEVGITDLPLELEIKASALTVAVGSLNQYTIYDLELVALP